MGIVSFVNFIFFLLLFLILLFVLCLFFMIEYDSFGFYDCVFMNYICVCNFVMVLVFFVDIVLYVNVGVNEF